MSFLYSFLNFFRPQFINGSNQGDLLFGGFGNDLIFGNGGNDKIFGGFGNDLIFGGKGNDHIFGGFGNDLIFGGYGNDKIYGGFGNDLMFGGMGNDKIFGGYGNDLAFGGAGNDKISGGRGNDNLNGGDGEDTLRGGKGDDRLVGNKGNDRMFGGAGDDILVWNNGDGSDLMNGGRGYDRVQVNFNTDLVNNDLQNKDVAEFSVTPKGVQFARVELNDQNINGLFQLDIRKTEVLETNFGGGDDTAQILDTVLDEIKLDLDGGDGIDTLDLARAAEGVEVDLSAGTVENSKAVNFENVIGTEFDDKITGDDQDNVISGLGGVDTIYGRAGNDTLVANKGNDFVFGEDGDDLLVWNNGDGSDLMDGGADYDRVQVNFNTDLVNNDLQNKDVAEFSVTPDGVNFARVEVNDQTVNGLFQLDIRDTEVLETNFGGGDDTAQIVDDVLDEIKLDLDGGDGIDTLDLSRAAGGVDVDLAAGTLENSRAVNFENVIGTEFDDKIAGDDQDNVISGLGGVDTIYGRAGNDTLVANKGNDFVFGEDGDDLLVWNNGDGSDLMDGGADYDRVQVNFNTDLVNNDLQNKDVAEFSVTPDGVQFARVEVNDQTVNGLFQLDIRDTEVLETNFGGGDDTAQIVDNVLDEIKLDLDGGDGIDTLDLSRAAGGVEVDLAAGTLDGSTAVNFENVTGTDFDDVITGDAQDNVIRSGSGFDILAGGEGADTFVFTAEDTGVKIITDFDLNEDRLLFITDENLTASDLVNQLVQDGDDVQLDVNGKLITFENASVDDFSTDDFLFA
ncbi:calcium-binding protein [uncultured Roseibium sp.]|uniref:calcium-binding protein n=1 Tax=uncultured Roseibium sp. TaxID=1936171 RepID=UPI0026166890|nr:calcium-binding protein [uncultured Roseibium sp.]